MLVEKLVIGDPAHAKMFGRLLNDYMCICHHVAGRGKPVAVAMYPKKQKTKVSESVMA